MDVTYRMDGRNLIISLSGELDHHAARTAMEAIERWIDQNLPGKTVLDLAGLSFMDSSGIAVVLQTAKECRNLGCALSVCGVGRQAMRVLSAAGVPKLVPVTERGRTNV